MNTIKPRSRTLLPVLTAALLLSHTERTQAAVIFNSGLDGTTLSNIANNGGGKAIGFALADATTLGVGGYSLDSITVRLTNSSASTEATGSSYTFSLWSDTGGGSAESTARLSSQLATFTGVAVPASSTGNYTLNISTPFTLQPSTIYWIAATSPKNDSSLHWNGTGGTAVTAAGVSVTAPAGKFGFAGPVSFTSNSGISNDIQINATAVPEPSSVLLLLGGIGVLAGFRRRG